MKTGLYGQSLTLMEQLKAATFLAHTQLEAAPFFQALVARQLPLESYVGQLRALATIHGVLEAALASCSHPSVVAVWHDELRKMPLLQQDLRFFEPRLVADLKEAVAAAADLAEHLHLQSLQQPLALLGYLYVLEGSTMGGSVLRRQFARAFLLTDEAGLSYLHSYGPAVHAHWADFQQRLNALPLSADESAQVTQAAADFFARLAGIFHALYPFAPESKTYLVTSINPEAGRHAVPADLRELAAAVRAGDVCWERFPYFEFRYGERGRRFAKSDGAWLATLCQFEPAKISQQVRWLGRVLSTRGMPTIMLQAKLEILFEELVAANPAQRAVYEKFLGVAAELRDARRRHFSDAQVAVLAGDFNRAVGAEWSLRYRNAGELLVAAVADERGGSTGTLENLCQWMTDPARFPADWIAAVQTLLAQAQAQAGLDLPYAPVVP